MKDSIILASLEGKNPANLKQLIPELDGGCAIDFTYLLESFAFKSINNNNVVVEFGLTHGCEVEKGTFTVIDIELPVPEYSKQMFIEAAKNKSTMEGINPGFIQETKQEKIDEALEIIAEQHREDSIKVVEKRENDFRTYFDQGRDYCSNGNYEKAIIDLTKALEILPDNIETLNWRTIAYMNSQDYDKSMADCSRILKLNPNYAEAYLHRGILYSFNQEHDKAISDYNKSIALDSNYIKTDNYCRRGISYFKKENYDQALSDFNKAIEDYSYNTMAYSCRGGVYLIKKEYDKAIMDYNKAIAMDSSKESTYYYNGRGLAYFGQEKFDDAIFDYNHAIKIDNNNSQAYFNRAAVYDRLNNYDKAISDYNKFIELSPANAVGYDNVGYACIKLKNYDKAILSFNKCIELNKSNFDAMLGLAITYYLKNDTTRALQSLNQAILTEPKLKKGMDGIKILEEIGYSYYDNDKIILKKLFDMVTK
jgi:tetratricopeptide (TPR) repeat protein